MYEDFHILIDDPASTLSLGFDDYASALSEIAIVSRPQFAIGIFGAWGAGKTTLMRAMQSEMSDRADIVPIWFNAWRYEREEHLIVPLLDTLREQVLEWSARSKAGPDDAPKASRLAGVLGRTAKAILAGLTLKAGVPKVIEVSLDANRVATQWRTAADGDPAACEPKSFYHAAFLALQSSVTEFLDGGDTGSPAGGRRRFVVFVDDIDRCLPTKALEVLESMKLFFDLEGFVFVVGLDQRIIERAVQLKYPADAGGPDGAAATYISGADYIKKIFQVQFTAPRIDQSQLESYLDAVADAGGLPESQRDDLATHVAPQIANLAGSSSVNPREVKRLINAYTMQMKILERKIAGSARTPSPSAVLALQIMSFRADWQAAYDALSNSPTEFVDSVSEALARGTSVIAVGDEVLELPPSLVSYLENEGSAVLHLDDLEVYVSALETARSTDPTIREIAQLLGRVRVALRSATPEDPGNVLELVQELGSRLSLHSDVSAAMAAAQKLRVLATNYPAGVVAGEGPAEHEAKTKTWLDQVGTELISVAQTVADLRRRSATAATSLS